MVVGVVDNLPNGVENLACRADVALADLQLKIAHLSVECRGHLSLGEGHGKVGKQADSVDFEVVGKADGVDDGARSDIDQCAGCEVSVLQVDIDVRLAVYDDSEAVVVDGKRRFLSHQQVENGGFAAHDAEFAIEENIFAYLRQMRSKDVAHPREVHQFGLFVHFFCPFCRQR